MKTINLVEKFERISEPWSPRIVAELNGSHVKLAKFKGEFIWHAHEREDEMFLVIEGSIRIRLEDRELTVGAGELAVIPRGVRHLPIADEEAKVLMLEPASTVNTGDETASERTVQAVWI